MRLRRVQFASRVKGMPGQCIIKGTCQALLDQCTHRLVPWDKISTTSVLHQGLFSMLLVIGRMLQLPLTGRLQCDVAGRLVLSIRSAAPSISGDSSSSEANVAEGFMCMSTSERMLFCTV
jgi:hypothetical protein